MRLVNCRIYHMVTAVVGLSIGRAAVPPRLEISVPARRRADIPEGDLIAVVWRETSIPWSAHGRLHDNLASSREWLQADGMKSAVQRRPTPECGAPYSTVHAVETVQ